MNRYLYTNLTQQNLKSVKYYQSDNILYVDIKRKMFYAYKCGCTDERCIKWDDLPSVGKYRRIKRFLSWYSKYIENL